MMRVKIDFSQCTGCRYCEVVCALEHFNVINPMKSRIRVHYDSDNRIWIPIIAGPFTDAQCTNKTIKVVGGVEIDGCVLCPASSCPSRHYFIEAGTGIPLKCDMCGEPPDPMCVKSCFSGALTLVN
jgi:benzoyl-CoA reductase subunit BamC